MKHIHFLSTMCLSPIPVVTTARRARRRGTPFSSRDHSNLINPTSSSNPPYTIAGSLWNCQSAVKKTETISAYTLSQSLHFLALTETWIIPENTATPAALSAAYSFSHTPRASGRGGALVFSFPLTGPTLFFLFLTFQSPPLNSMQFLYLFLSSLTLW